MSNYGSFRRKLNAKNVWIAEEVRRKKLEIAKHFVEEKVKTDPEFARDVLTALGVNLPPEIKKAAEATLKAHAKKVNEEEYQKGIGLSAQALADTIDNDILNKMISEGSKVVIEKTTGIGTSCCGHQCGCHSDDGMVQVQSDGGGIHLVHETELPDYPMDG
jgi:3-oxoacyl-ACP reductase-like protein